MTDEEKNLIKEKFKEEMRMSWANKIADASDEELNNLFEEFIKLSEYLKNKSTINDL